MYDYVSVYEVQITEYLLHVVHIDDEDDAVVGDDYVDDYWNETNTFIYNPKIQVTVNNKN